MASSAAKALRRARANERLEAEVTAVAAALNVELPAPPRLAGDPDLAATQRVEHQADTLAAIRQALGTDAVDLEDMKRDDLNRLAAEQYGVTEPDALPNKGAVIAAIRERQA